MATLDGGGISRVKGPHMIRLQQYLLAADAADIDAHIANWQLAEELFTGAAEQFTALAKGCGDAFAESSYTAQSADRSYKTAAAQMREKAETIMEARRAVARVAERYDQAKKAYDLHEGRLPTSHGPTPSASDPAYTTEGYSGAEKEKRETALGDAKAQHAKDAQAIADAEREAAFQCQQIDDGNQEAEPKVRAITEPPSSTSPGSNGSGGSGSSSGGYSSPGSRSAVAAAQARYDSVNPGTLYAEGEGHQIRAEQKEIIRQAQAENIPEWDHASGTWVNADGSPAPATSYASVETAEGLAPLGGGAGGATALGLGLGGAGLAVGAAAALRAKFGAGAAAAAGKVSASSSPAKAAAGRAAGAAPRVGAPGQAARSAAGGARGAGGRAAAGAGAGGRAAAGAGSRSQMRGAGAGAAGRGGRGKDKQSGDPDLDFVADYSADYSDEEYERLLALKRFDDEQKRQLRNQADH